MITDSDPKQTRFSLPPALAWLLGLGLFFGIGYAISLLPAPIYDDWYVFRPAALALIKGEPVYNTIFEFWYYYNPPWIALILLPFSLLSFEFGAGMMVITTLVCTAAVCHYFKLDLLKTALALISPLNFYLIIHAQVDALVLAGVLLPISYWPLVAISKPQIAITLGIEALKKQHLRSALIISGSIFAVSLLVFGLWPLEVLGSPPPVAGPHNLWYTVWPRNLPAGLLLLFFWWNRGRDDIRWLIAAAPFLGPYASAGSFLGFWIVMHTELKNWQAVMIFLTAWAAVITAYLA